MRGLQIRISLELLLDWMGLEPGKIEFGAVAVDTVYPNVLVMVLRGDDERLPEIKSGQQYPKGTVVCTKTLEKVGVQGKIVVEA